MAKIQLKRWGGGKQSFANFRQICFDFAYFFLTTTEKYFLSNCLIRCVCKKSFLSFPYISMVKSKQICWKFAELCPLPISSTEFPPLYMCCNIHHFGITKLKVMASKTTSYAHKTTSYAFKIYKFDSRH